ncbi:MAG TPA: C10 family peptidase, partial [candidate division Zixibacteria bacterium]|nr:C10 family peptidase [candidate division Zixibacteria bacterium]
EDPSPPSSDTAVVGCVATAAAQIMYFWNWPPSGTGSYSYTWDGDQTCGQPAGSTPAQTLSANFSDAYDWGNMRDSYTGGESQAQRDAAAELCYEAAVAAGMDFGVCGSGTSTDTVLTAFPMYFRYSAATIDKENRTDHTADEWFQLLAAEVDAGRPVQYRINSHSIVCDGYRDTPSDQVHMNYGWGGGANTWYAVDNFYCYWIAGEICPWDEEYMIRGIQPDNLPPVAQCADVTVDADDNCQAAAASIDNGSYDPEGYAVTLEQIPAAPYPLGATLVTLRVTDPQGGVATCEATVTVVDVTPPIITCPSDRTFECDDIGDFGWPTATDNCDSDPAITLASRDSVPGGCPQEYRLVLGYKAEDFSGNAAGCSQTITIIDTTSPVVDCYDTLGFVFTSPTEAEVFWDASATDNCSPAPTVTCDPPSGTTFPIGEHTVTCIADDGCANTDTCAFTFRLVPFDLHPTSCPNPIAVKSVVPAAILGTSDFDVLDVDPSSLRARGVAPLRWTYEDVSTPVGDDPNQNCECTRAKGDGRKDLTLKFDHAALVATFAPGELVDGGSVMLQITGLLKDGTPLAGGDCLILRYKPKDTPAESGPVAVTELGAWNSPNPFNPATVIGYQLPEPGHVKITVFNMLGQVVAHLIDQWQEAGQHSVSWSGERAASGVYFYRLEVGEAQLTRKMLLLK